MLKFIRIIFVINLLFESVVLQLLPPPTVNLITSGSLRGFYLYSVQGRVIDCFLGIPYAEPPVGTLRFADPQPASSWTGQFDATKRPEPCMQFDVSGPDKTPFGSEDCLYLNVYTPRERSSSPILPVMVWLHGGAYYFGSSDPLLYGPERLLDNDVVLVTLNYRLGPFGFLSTKTQHAPGNFGLKDQNLALRWIRENIAAFGGNLDDVTLFGQSAGSASTSLHMISPVSADLFHKAILQSGNYFDKWAIIRGNKAVDRAHQLARSVQCPVPSDKDYFQMINCLKNIPADKIVSAQLNFFVFPTGDPVTLFGPVVEPPSDMAFLEQDPRDVDRSHGDSIPIIIGVTSEEGLVKSAAIINQLTSEFQQSFETVLPTMLFYDHKSSHTQIKLTKKIKKFYFKNGLDWSRKNHHNLTNMFSDRLFFAGLDQYLRKRLSDPTSADTYVYLFDHNGPKSTTEIFGGGSKSYGVCHGDELAFLFSFGQIGYRSKKRDRQIHYALPKMWTDFAKTGDPTPSGSIITQKWHRATKFPYRYVRIGDQNDYSKHISHHDSHRHHHHHHHHHRETDKIENHVAKAYENEPREKTEEELNPVIEGAHLLDDTFVLNEETGFDRNFQQDFVDENDKDPTFDKGGVENVNLEHGVDYVNVERGVDYVKVERGVGNVNAEPAATEQIIEEAYQTTTALPVTTPFPRWKHSGGASKKCYIYTTKDPCAILKNRKDRFWTGFTY